MKITDHLERTLHDQLKFFFQVHMKLIGGGDKRSLPIFITTEKSESYRTP